MELIDIAPADLETVQRILLENAPGLEVRAFGSRVSWAARETSDLDLALMTNQPMSIARMAKLKAAFTESDLPFRVEVVDWANTPESFRKVIEKKYIAISASLVSGPGSLTANLTVVPMGDCIEINDSVYSPREAWPFINYLDTSNITENRISEIHHLVAKKDEIPSRARRKVKPGDIVYSTVRPDRKHFGLLKEIPENFLASTGFSVIRGINGVACTDFIYWFLAQDHIVEQLHTIAEHSTSAYPSIKPSDIEQLKLKLPSLPEQRAIAHVLGTLDDKIELNRRMNETLEEMARALFKSWFVDFDPVHAKAALKNHSPSNFTPLKREKTAQGGEWTVERARAYLDGMDPNIAALFPDRFVDSELGKIPEGWEVKTLGEFGDVITGKTPSTRNPEFYGKDVPFLKIPDMHGRIYVTETGTMLSNKGARSQSAKALPSGSVSVSCIATPGLVILNHRWTHTNQQINSIVPREDYISKYLYQSCKELSSNILIGGSGGSVFGNMNKSTFSSLVIIDAGNKAIRAFDEVVSPLHKAILANEKERNYLTALRDTLLPKLVSGELRVNTPDTRTLNSP